MTINKVHLYNENLVLITREEDGKEVPGVWALAIRSNVLLLAELTEVNPVKFDTLFKYEFITGSIGYEAYRKVLSMLMLMKAAESDKVVVDIKRNFGDQSDKPVTEEAEALIKVMLIDIKAAFVEEMLEW